MDARLTGQENGLLRVKRNAKESRFRRILAGLIDDFARFGINIDDSLKAGVCRAENGEQLSIAATMFQARPVPATGAPDKTTVLRQPARRTKLQIDPGGIGFLQERRGLAGLRVGFQ